MELTVRAARRVAAFVTSGDIRPLQCWEIFQETWHSSDSCDRKGGYELSILFNPLKSPLLGNYEVCYYTKSVDLGCRALRHVPKLIFTRSMTKTPWSSEAWKLASVMIVKLSGSWKCMNNERTVNTGCNRAKVCRDTTLNEQAGYEGAICFHLGSNGMGLYSSRVYESLVWRKKEKNLRYLPDLWEGCSRLLDCWSLAVSWLVLSFLYTKPNALFSQTGRFDLS